MTTATTTPCWICDAPARQDAVLEAAGYFCCDECGLVFQAARDSAVSEAARYDHDYFAVYGNDPRGDRAYDDEQQRRLEADERIALVRTHVSGGSLLEVGSASGYFVEAAARAGFEARGIEPSSVEAEKAADKGLSVTSETLADAAGSGRSYDAVCAWHVLEHLPEPRVAVQQFRSLLAPHGLLFLELPNIASVLARRGGATWVHLDPDNHVAHYTPSTVERLLVDGGFDVVLLRTTSIRAYRRHTPARAYHTLYDALRLGAPRLHHAGRHELIQVVARHGTSDHR